MNKPIVKILVCCHKPGEWLSDDVYMPIQCGKAISKYDLGIQGDDTGDNISAKNPYYCELTALYWAWKNLKNIDYIGLCHYRRYFDFSFRPFIQKETKNITESQLRANLDCLKIDKSIENYDVILPTSNPWRTNLFERHAINLDWMDLCVMEEIILKLYPDYKKSLESVFYHKQSVPQRNMFIMKRNIFEQYCEFLFKILSEVEKHIKPSPYAYYRRACAFMGEMLLPLFCYHNKLKTRRRMILFVDGQGINSSFLFDIALLFKNKLCFALSFLIKRPICSVLRRDLLQQEFPELFQ